MQLKLTVFTTLATFATLAAATPWGSGDSGPSNQCNPGAVQCCQDVQKANALSSTVLGLCALLGIDVSSITADVGVTCTPITVVGAGSNSCSTQPVCCTNNSFNGVLALGCSPINV